MTNISNRDELQKLIEKYVKGTISEAEIAFLEKYYDQFDDHNDGLSQLNDIQRRMLKGEMKEAIHHSIQLSPSRTKPFNVLLKIAASILLIIAAGFIGWQFLSKDNFESMVMEKNNFLVSDSAMLSEEHIYLSDGSYVLLSPGSVLTYKKGFDDKIREVQLNGEAFFDIYRDTLRPFIVHSNGVETRVLGTAFTISSFNDIDSVTVSVTRGKVQVSGNSGPAEILEKDDQVVVDKKSMEITKRRLNIEESQDMEPEEFIFDNIQMKNAVDIVSKRWNCKVILEHEGLEGCRFTSSFTRGDSLEDIVAVICAVIGAEYKIENNTVNVRGPGCN